MSGNFLGSGGDDSDAELPRFRPKRKNGASDSSSLSSAMFSFSLASHARRSLRILQGKGKDGRPCQNQPKKSRDSPE